VQLRKTNVNFLLILTYHISCISLEILGLCFLREKFATKVKDHTIYQVVHIVIFEARFVWLIRVHFSFWQIHVEIVHCVSAVKEISESIQLSVDFRQIKLIFVSKFWALSWLLSWPMEASILFLSSEFSLSPGGIFFMRQNSEKLPTVIRLNFKATFIQKGRKLGGG